MIRIASPTRQFVGVLLASSLTFLQAIAPSFSRPIPQFDLCEYTFSLFKPCILQQRLQRHGTLQDLNAHRCESINVLRTAPFSNEIQRWKLNLSVPLAIRTEHRLPQLQGRKIGTQCLRRNGKVGNWITKLRSGQRAHARANQAPNCLFYK